MINVRKSADRGAVNLGWLEARHSFSFGSYYDPGQMGFGPLRVINEDRIQPGQGFPTHGHRDMEIVTYIIDGALEHRDSMGNGSVIRRGDVQRMTAGSGVRHSEFNHSSVEITHLLQIWLLPERAGLPPGYEEKNFADVDKKNRLRLIASRDARDASLVIHQDADLYATVLDSSVTVEHILAEGRLCWIQVVRGALTVNGASVGPGDGVSLTAERSVSIAADEESELLLFDMAQFG
ncbi:MAG: pirin family protein [Gammaproteobacteria bacterium]|nr:pirin family protein [Gammaproteobacteria bacterium]